MLQIFNARRRYGLNVTNIQCEKEVQHHLDNLPLCGSANTTASRFFMADFAVKRRSMEPLLRDSDDTPWQRVTHTATQPTSTLGWGGTTTMNA